MQHRIVIIGSLKENVELTRRAKKRGYYTIVCDGNQDGPAKKEADKAYTINIRDVDAVAKMCIEENVDGIIGSFSDLICEQITKIADKAGLKWYLKPDQLKYYREKNDAKKLMQDLGIHVPKNCTITRNFVEADLKDFAFPLVIKPVNGWGSRSIYVVKSIDEIREKYDEVQSFSDRDMIEIEEYSQGREYNMMTCLADGEVYVMSIADREKNPQVGNKVPLVNRVVYPAKNIDKIVDDAKKVIERFTQATGQKDGFVSMQFFRNEKGIEVCEIAGRMLGYEHDLITRCSGLDIEELMLDYVYDGEMLKKRLQNHSPIFKNNYEALVWFGVDGKTLKNQGSLFDMKKYEQVEEIWPFYNEGDVIDNQNVSHVARIVVHSEDREELDEITRHIFDEVHFDSSDGETAAQKPVYYND